MKKRLLQSDLDRDRSTDKLYFPSDLDVKNVIAWLRTTTGTLRSKKGIGEGAPSMVFEMWSTPEGIKHRLKVPWQYKDYIISQLRGLVPGIRYEQEDEWPRRLWRAAVEVGLTNSERQLRIYEADKTAASLLSSVQPLNQGEAVVVQFVVTPAAPQESPTYQKDSGTLVSKLLYGASLSRAEVKDQAEKLAEPNMLAVLRIGADANTPIRAQHLVHRVRSALVANRTASTTFVRRVVGKNTLQHRIDTAAAPLTFPMQLSVSELAALIAWPIGNPNISGLPAARSRQLVANDTVPSVGRIIGRSNFPGNERSVAMSFENACKHTHILGPTGVGKTVLLANMLKQDIAAGHGVVLIENKGDLFNQAIKYVPWERLDDVIVMDVSDTRSPVGFNILRQGDPKVVVDELVGLFEHMYKTDGVWTKEVLYHGLQTLITDPRYTFVDLATLLAPMSREEVEWADHMRRSVKDPQLKVFWQRFDNQDRKAQDRITAPVMDRIWQLNARPEIRNIIGQTESSFNMADVITGNKILLVNLAGLPKDTASLLGTLLMNALWHAVKSHKPSQPNFLYLDEFQDFINLPVDANDMLAKARSFGLGMTLAHQHLGQLPNELRQAVLANARTKIVFQTTSDDARIMAREFGAAVSEHDFMSLGRYEAIARVATAEGISAPLTLSTLAPSPGNGFGRELVSRSRKNYGRPVTQVEADILARRSVPDNATKKRGNIGIRPLEQTS